MKSYKIKVNNNYILTKYFDGTAKQTYRYLGVKYSVDLYFIDKISDLMDYGDIISEKTTLSKLICEMYVEKE